MVAHEEKAFRHRQISAGERAYKDDIRKRWLLSAPALFILIVGATGPLLLILVYSFLTPGSYGGVDWKLSTDAWVKVLLERDMFDGTISLADANLIILGRSVFLSLCTTILTFLIGFPIAYFIVTREGVARRLALLMIAIPFWTNLLVRIFAVQELLRDRGVINGLLMSTGLIGTPITMLYTNFSLLVGMTYVYLPLMVLPLFASLERLDFQLLNAAYDLYAKPSKAIIYVVLPVVRPGIIAGSILVFIPSLGDYVTPTLLSRGANLMIGNYIGLQFGQGRDWPFGSSLSMTLMALVLVALLVFVRNASGEKEI